LSYFGDSSWNAQYLSELDVFDQIKSEAFQEGGDYYIRKYLAILMSKLFCRNIIKMDFANGKKFKQLLHDLLDEGLAEQASGALEIMTHLGLIQPGIDLLYGDKDLMQSLVLVSKTTKKELKAKLFACLGGFFTQMQD